MPNIKTYGYNDGVQLSPHFNSNEFRCKCGVPHDILIDLDLIDKLEDLHTAFNCHSIIINSGYRCSKHDKTMGNGKGMHTKGQAADIVCKDKNRNIISSKDVCCKAQDLGFGGIANINTSYNSTHVDTRDTKWYGDETKGNSSVTSDFYKYFGIKRDNEVEDDKYLTKEELQEIINHLKKNRNETDDMIHRYEALIK